MPLVSPCTPPRESNCPQLGLHPSYSPAIQFCIRGHRSAKAGWSHDQHKGLWVGSLSHPSRGSVGCGWAIERRGRANGTRTVGDGQRVWGKEARKGGVLTVVEEALRCFSEEFSSLIPPL